MLITLAGLFVGGIALLIGMAALMLTFFFGVPLMMAYAWALITVDLDNMPDWRGFGIWKRTMDILFN